ncbi:unnamed protein product [Cyprideis torosa]|uniref:Uncharacterized protein n=1 Tax=Cyprideis torosa TaxID=163714 RepID=A0A7R8W365_9CRUS|nr:unnamed protein product [Cyprideis torosa]CAG0882709.1 unnamed protein product [Cyprideis torosa]
MEVELWYWLHQWKFEAGKEKFEPVIACAAAALGNPFKIAFTIFHLTCWVLTKTESLLETKRWTEAEGISSSGLRRTLFSRRTSPPVLRR